MSHPSRRPAFLAFAPLLLVSLIACTGGASPSSPPGASPSDAPPGESPSPSAIGGIDHETGATDVLLRYEEGGGFMMAGFAQAEAPTFTLYGDGTVIFRNPLADTPPIQGSVMRFAKFTTAKLSEEQITELLTFALGEGGLAAARPTYENNTVTDATTAVFTIDAGGIKKTVSVYALDSELEPTHADVPARAAFAKLVDRLVDLDQGGATGTSHYEPDAYRASLIDSPGIEAPDIVDWPWDDLTIDDFKTDADPNGLSFPHATLTPAQVEQLGVTDHEGGFHGLVLRGSDGKLYTVALRPLLPDDETA